jgi:type IV secretory pathway protease TraF
MTAKKFIISLISTCLVVAILIIAIVAYHFATLPSLQLIVGMNPKDSSPVLQWISKEALYSSRPTKEDISSLNREAGARYMATFPNTAEAEKMLNYFLSNGLDINSRDQASGNHLTALQEAALEGNPGPVKLLLKYGADVNARDSQGRTVLDLVKQSQLNRKNTNFGPIIKILEAASAKSSNSSNFK